MSDRFEQTLRLQRHAGALGFDWPQLEMLWDKLAEEVAELREAAGIGPAEMQDELGDVLFMVINLARHLGVDPDGALAGANAKFAQRFALIESRLDSLPSLGDARRLDAMEAIWREAKQRET